MERGTSNIEGDTKMTPNMLIATGIMDTGIDLSKDVSGVNIKQCNYLIEALEALEANKNMYDYIFISSVSFSITGGVTEDDALATLATVLSHCQYQKFLFLDCKHMLEIKFNQSMIGVSNKCYYSVETPIRLRHYTTLIKSMLNNSETLGSQASEPESVQPKKKVVKPAKAPVKKPSLLNFISDKKDELSIKSAIKKKTKSSTVETVPNGEELPPPADDVENLPAYEPVQEEPTQQQQVFEPVAEVEVEPETQIPQVVQQPIDARRFMHTSVMFTNTNPKDGCTSVALMFTQALRNEGLNVCYVQLTKKLSTCRIYLASDRTLPAEYSNPFEFINRERFNLTDSVSVFNESIHFIANDIDIVSVHNERQLSRFIMSANTKFDTVIYDVDFELLKEFPSIVSLFTFKNIVVSNSCDSLLALQYQYVNCYSDDSTVALYSTMLRNSNFVISKIVTSNTESINYIEPDQVISTLVESIGPDSDTDDSGPDTFSEDISELEFLPVVAYIPFKSDIMYNLFSADNLKYILPAISRMR